MFSISDFSVFYCLPFTWLVMILLFIQWTFRFILQTVLDLFTHRSDVCQYIMPTMIPRMKTYPKTGAPLKREAGGREGRKEGGGTCEPLSREIDCDSKPATGGDCGTSKLTRGGDCGTSKPTTGGDCGTRRSVRTADSGKTGRRRASNKSDSIKAAFLAACEQGDLEKVFNATWSQDHKIEKKHYNFASKVKAAILLGVDVNHRLLGTRYWCNGLALRCSWKGKIHFRDLVT